MEITIENVESALAQFYRTNSTLQAEAHQWLMALQNSPNAWSFVWELLQPNRSCEAQFFASNTLHLKIVNNWSEVPEDQYENLKTKLLQTIIAYSSGPKIVLNRLCIALAVYLLRVTPTHWPHSIEDIHNIFRPENLPDIPSEQAIWIFLEILSVIPEELNSVTLTNAQRQVISAELRKAGSKVMVTLANLLDYNNSEVRSLAAKGVYTWMSIGFVPISESLNVTAKIVNVIKQTHASDPYESCEHEIEALCQIMTHPFSHKYKKSILPGLEILLELHPLLQHSENQDFITNVCNLYVAFGEAHGALLLKSLISNDTRSVQTVQTWLKCLLMCLSANGSFPKDETQSHLVISFWSSLYDEKNVLRPEENKAVNEQLEPLYKELCRVLLFKSQFPPDNVTLSASEAEQLRIYRQDIADTIVNCYLLVRRNLFTLLESTLANAKTWQEVESVLHIVYSLAETTWNWDDESEEDGDDVKFGIMVGGGEFEEERDSVVSLLVKIPPNLVNAHVINSLNIAIGAYAEWWVGHSNVLGRLIPTLIASLQDPATSTSATMALKDITRECTTSIKPFAPTLLNACQEALESRRLQEDEYVRLMFSVGKLLSILPYEEMLVKLDSVINYYEPDINNALSQKTDQAKGIIISRLKMLSNLCSSLYLSEKVDVEPPTLLVLRRLLPLLNTITEHWSSNIEVIEEVCKCLKSSVMNLLESCRPFLEEITKVALTGYVAQPNTVVLDLTRQLFLLFGKTHSQFIADVVRSVSDTTVALAVNNKASSSSDVIQVYLQTMYAIGKRSIMFLEMAINLRNLFNFTTVALMLPEPPTVKAAGQFLGMLISKNRNHHSVCAIIENSGEYLVETLLRCIGADTTPRSVLSIFADIILALNRNYCENLAIWLNTLLSRENFPTDKASSAAKLSFVRSVLRARQGNRVLESVKEFALVCRGMVHYSSQPTSVFGQN